MRVRARPIAASRPSRNAPAPSTRVRALCLGVALAAACSVYDESLLVGPGPIQGAGGKGVSGATALQGGVLGAGGHPSGGQQEAGGAGAVAGSGGATSSSGGVTSAGQAGTQSGGGATSTGEGGTQSGVGGAASGGTAQGGSVVGPAGGKAASGGASAGTGGATSGGAANGGVSSGGGKAVLFSENFESGVARWTTNTSGDWNVVTDGTKAYEQSTLSAVLRTAIAGSNWNNQSVEARIKILAFGGTSTSYFAGVYARYVDDENHYCLAIRGDGKYAIRRRVSGSNTTIGSAFSAVPVVVDTWHTLKLEVIGTTLNAYVDGILFHTETDSSLTQGRVGIGSTNTTARFDDVSVTEP